MKGRGEKKESNIKVRLLGTLIHRDTALKYSRLHLHPTIPNTCCFLSNAKVPSWQLVSVKVLGSLEMTVAWFISQKHGDQRASTLQLPANQMDCACLLHTISKKKKERRKKKKRCSPP